MHKRHRNLPARTAHLPESAEQRGKKSAEFSEESARRRLIGRRRLSAGWFRLSVCAWRKRSGQSRCRPWTRIQRQRTHILDRRGRRAGRVEHERRLYLHVKFVWRDERVKRSGRRARFIDCSPALGCFALEALTRFVARSGASRGGGHPHSSGTAISTRSSCPERNTSWSVALTW